MCNIQLLLNGEELYARILTEVVSCAPSVHMTEAKILQYRPPKLSK